MHDGYTFPYIVSPITSDFSSFTIGISLFSNHFNFTGEVVEFGLNIDGLRNIGPAPSPFNSFLMLQGLETLSLRAERCCENTLAVAEFLEKHPAVESVNYPGLKSNPYHELGCKYLKHGFGGVLTFRVKGGFEAAASLVTRLELILHVGSVGDAKSLIVHPASTTHSQLSPEEQVAAGVYPNMLRLSVGIENVDDLIADLAAALQ